MQAKGKPAAFDLCTLPHEPYTYMPKPPGGFHTDKEAGHARPAVWREQGEKPTSRRAQVKSARRLYISAHQCKLRSVF